MCLHALIVRQLQLQFEYSIFREKNSSNIIEGDPEESFLFGKIKIEQQFSEISFDFPCSDFYFYRLLGLILRYIIARIFDVSYRI